MKRRVFTIGVILFWGCSLVFAEPMFAPTKEQAFKSQLIAIVEYSGYQLLGKIDYFSGPVARYKIIRILKGANVSKALDVRYDFTDGSACLPEVGWKFSEDLMPKKGSRWILFLNEDSPMKYWATYRGPFGRWSADFKNTLEVENALSKGQLKGD
ncbi:MAG: hypothetical protein HQL16_00130 [Candidatus Omnitrophica bacterium]|nr:hypothetical protein [Candidatus Omnitrophota bacterium]